MNHDELEFLKQLTQAPSPSGFESPAARIMRSRLEGVADEIETNALGSVHAILRGKGSAPSVLIAGHLDEIGMMVKFITESGYICFDAIGGVDAAILPGIRVDVHTKSGPIRGVMGRLPYHLIEADMRKTVTSIDKLFIDVGLSGKDAKEKIEIGDPITFLAPFEEFGDGYAVSRAFDDKLGVWLACRALEEMKKAGGSLGDVYAVGTAQEEIGLRGGGTSAYSLRPDIAISVEVGHATDYPDMDKRKYGQADCGAGPLIARGANMSPVVTERLIAAAKDAAIPFQIDPSPNNVGTDANTMQISRGSVATGLVSIPLRYMHTPIEVLKLEDLDNALKLLVQFILNLEEGASFIPM